MFCPNCGNKLSKIGGDSWKYKMACFSCQSRMTITFPDRMGGYYRQYDLSLFDQGFRFKEEEENAEKVTKNLSMSDIDLRD